MEHGEHDDQLRDSGIVISIAFCALDAVYHDNVVCNHRCVMSLPRCDVALSRSRSLSRSHPDAPP